MKTIIAVSLLLVAGMAFGQDNLTTNLPYGTDMDLSSSVTTGLYDERAEIRDVLERCLEFINPPHKNDGYTYAIHRTRIGELEHQIELEKERITKEKRTEELRHDIERILQAIGDNSNNKD